VAAYNRTPHSSTSLTPYKLMYGQEARLPVEAEFGVPAPQVRTNHLVDWMLKGAHDANAIARRVTNRVQLRNKDAYDAGVVTHIFKPGDLVRVADTVVPKGTSPKFHRIWSEPVVVESIRGVDVVIRDSKGKRKVVHHDRVAVTPLGTK